MTLKTFQWLPFAYGKKPQIAYPVMLRPSIFASNLIFQSVLLLESIISSVEAILYLLFLECMFFPLPVVFVEILYTFRAQVRELLYQDVERLFGKCPAM